MYISKNASRARQREAQNARNNRAEIIRALSVGEISRRDLFRWGIFTTVGALAYKNGLSPYAPSAYGQVPTGTPRSPLGTAQRFTEPLNRLQHLEPIPLTRVNNQAVWPSQYNERNARRMSWHNEFTADPTNKRFRNPLTGRGPIEGRPPGEVYAHQRWDEYFPKAGYVLSWAPCAGGTYFHHGMTAQQANRVWCYGEGKAASGSMPPPLIKARYGEPILMRVYNNLPQAREDNGSFGRNETQLHMHNAHNGAESDGAANVHHYPGTFYDYRWSTTLARADKINKGATNRRASGPDGNGGLNLVPGDFREIQGSLWFHDHRFFFTAENVYKGNLGVINIYSGPDRGNEELQDGINLCLPSGNLLDYGNTDFDVNLVVSDGAFDRDGQYFFDIFTTDGFIGDVPLVNFGYAPFMEVIPRKYRFRILNACMSRFIKLGLSSGSKLVPFQVIANDGNLLVNAVTVNQLDQQGIAERFDIIVDFSQFPVGSKIRLVNTVSMRDDGRGPKDELSLVDAQKRQVDDPCLGAIMEFRVVGAVPSVDVLGVMHRAGEPDKSKVPASLTQQIPIVTPVRTRVVEFGRSGTGDSRGADGKCIPDCPEHATFPWTIKINGQAAHSMNSNRISLLIPEPGQIEHWTYINGGGGWDHPIHLHFEEGVTLNRGGGAMAPTEVNARKDVWRLRDSGRVTFQVQFGEFAGAYVNHCHNTVHEDFAMLMRVQLLSTLHGGTFKSVTSTPNPTPDGVLFDLPPPVVLPEGDPRQQQAASTNTTTGG